MTPSIPPTDSPTNLPMSPADRENLRQELLELHFGCHENPEALEARLAADTEVRALYEEVKGAAAVLDFAARAPAGGAAFVPPAADSAAEPASARTPGPKPLSAPARSGFWTPFRAAAGLLIAVLLAGPALLWTSDRAALADHESAFARLEVAGSTAATAGAAALYTVATLDGHDEPVAAPIGWKALGRGGAVLASGLAESPGIARIEVPTTLQDPVQIRFSATAPGGEVAAETLVPFPAVDPAGPPLVHLAVDKPAYRPGELVRWRALLLDRLTLRPQAGQIKARIVDPQGNAIQPYTMGLDDGVAAGTWPVPPECAGGTYAIEIRDFADTFTVERLAFLVNRYEPPKLAKTIDLDRETYAPGEKGRAEIVVARAEGGPAANAQADASLVIDGEVKWTAAAKLDAAGRAVFDFQVPAEVARGDARVNVRVSDGAVVETAVKPFVVPTGRLSVAFHPEGGDLPADLPCRVYAEVTDALGRPADAKGRILDAAGRTVARFETVHQGRARFEVAARAGDALRLLIEEPAGTPPIDLPAPKAGAVALRASADTTPAGKPVALTVDVPGDGPWLVAACCRGRTVRSATLRGRGRHEVALDPGEDVAGVLRVTVFDALFRPVAERLVRRASGRDLRVGLAPAHGVLAPGARQEVEVVVTDEAGKPVRALLGLCAADAAVRSMTEDHRVGLADRAWFVADAEELERVEEFLGGDADSDRNIDLVLGTRGWRRFRWNDGAAFVAEHGDKAKRRQALDGRASLPIVAAARSGSGGGVARLRADVARDARLWLGCAGLAAVFAALLFWRRPVAAPATVPARRAWRLALGTAGCLGLLFAGLLSFRTSEARGGFLRPWEADGMLAVASAEPPVVAWAQPPQPGFDQFAWASNVPLLGWRVNQDFVAGPIIEDAIDALSPGIRLGIPVTTTATGNFNGVLFTMTGLPAGAVTARENLSRLGELQVMLVEEVAPEGEERNLRLPLLLPAQDLPVGWAREYAHTHDRGPARTDFTETIYWNALVRTGDDGKAKVAFDLSDRVTTWEVWADAHGSGRLGQGRATFEARLPFRLEPSLPVEVTEGDTLLLPVAVIGEKPELAEALVAAAVKGPLRLKGEVQAAVALRDGRGRRLVEVEALAGKDPGTLVLTGSCDRWTDSVVKPVRVVARGFPRRWSRSGVARGFAEVVVPAPDAVVPGSARCAIKFYPSPLATLGDGVEGLLGEPGGCFEQVSSTNYPNVLALTLMKSTGDGSPSVSARAKDLLAKGYRMLTGYECKGGGFEWFGHGEGHTGLTAYGLAEFHDMAKVHDVDAAMMARTRKWLLDRRDGKGGFRHTAGGLHTFGRVGAATQDAYVTWALMEAGTAPAELAKELDLLASRAATTGDAYELAVAACALQKGGRADAAAGARKRLKSLQDAQGFVAQAKTSLTDSGGNDLLVETTGFAVLAWLADPEDRAHVDRAMEWILSQRQGAGTFGTTQATVMALKAICACAATSRPEVPGGDVVVSVNGTEVRRLALDPKSCQVLKVEGLEELLSAGGNTVRVEVPEKGELPYVLDFAYTSDLPADDPECKVGIATSLAAASAEEGGPLALQVEVTNRTADPLPMVLAVVGLPASLTVSEKVLDALKDAGRFDHWEIRGRDVVLYWRSFAASEVRSLVLDTIAALPGSTSGPASRASLYYTPDSVSWVPGLAVQVRPKG